MRCANKAEREHETESVNNRDGEKDREMVREWAKGRECVFLLTNIYLQSHIVEIMVFPDHHFSLRSSTSFSLLDCMCPEDFTAVFVASVLSFLQTILVEVEGAVKTVL